MVLQEQILKYFHDGVKTKEEQRVGIELESFLVKKDLSTISEADMLLIVKKLAGAEEWALLDPKDPLKGLSSKWGSITFEPGLQIEFSSAPELTVQEIEKGVEFFDASVKKALDPGEVFFLKAGHHPLQTPENTPLVHNKPRYSFMDEYMQKVGTLGRNMMRNAATLQLNYDYTSEEDLTQKVQVIAALTPFLTYLCASSPFLQGKLTNFLSFRTHVWENTDSSRTGMPEFFFQGNFTIEKYVEYLLNIPVYFLVRNNELVLQGTGKSFKDILSTHGQELDIGLEDFIHHALTAFPDIRIKQFIEVRACDSSPLPPSSIAGFLCGLLYTSSLTKVVELTSSISESSYRLLKEHLNTKGLLGTCAGIRLKDFLVRILELAKIGLTERGLKEEIYLAPLEKIIDSRTNYAEQYKKDFSHGSLR